MKETLRRLADRYGVDRLGFLTITFPDRVNAREASRRFNNLNRRVLSTRYVDWVSVFERGGKSKLPHFHLVVVCDSDIRTGCNFEEIEAGNYKSANEALRAEWKFWRSITNYDGKRPHAAYPDIGRTELLPVKSTADGIRKYVGKYIEKHMEQRLKEDKGVRLLRMSRGASNITTNFSWLSPGNTLWRMKLANWAKAQGYASTRGIKGDFGPRWAYLLRDVIMATPLDLHQAKQVRAYAREGGGVEHTALGWEDIQRHINRGVPPDLLRPEWEALCRGSGAEGAPVSQDTKCLA